MKNKTSRNIEPMIIIVVTCALAIFMLLGAVPVSAMAAAGNFSFDGAAPAAATQIIGDINGDRLITVTDFLQIKAHLLQKVELTGAAAISADINVDGKITVTDFVQLKTTLLLQGPLMQEAENAYTEYLIENEGVAAEYMLYDADGRWVALHNGTAVGVYESEEDARSAMSPDMDLYNLSTTNNGKLYIYTADKEAYFMAQLSGKQLSILGDSISTFQGVSNDSAEGLNKNAVYYSNQITREDTYWQQILTAYDMNLCVNNSWSGAYVSKHRPNVSGNLDPDGTISSGMARANKLAKADETSPDYIIVYIGVNDLIAKVSKNTVANAYNKMLDTIVETYPNAKVFCLNMPNTAFNGRIDKQLSELYNSTIDDAITAHNNVYLIDLYNSEYSGTIYEVNSIDKLHPNANGMDYMTDIIIDGIKKAILADYSK